MKQQGDRTEDVNHTNNIRIRPFEFTGKELDEETGYGYFGARYYDPTLLTGWTAVDPMADKYPNISPYAYCAWNPMKLVDPDGREIDVSELDHRMQERLCKCLGTITGLKLSVSKDGKLISNGENNEALMFSSSARKDLLEVIESEDRCVYVNQDAVAGRDPSEDLGWDDVIRLGDAHDIDFDAKTNGLGMMFMHELGHAFWGDNDPCFSENAYYWDISNWESPTPNTTIPVGDAVNRVNKYRKELNMPTRMMYEAYSSSFYNLRASWNEFDGKLPFQNPSGGIEWLKIR